MMVTTASQIKLRKSLLGLLGNPNYEHNHGDILLEWEQKFGHRFAIIAYLGHKVDVFVNGIPYMNRSIDDALVLVKGFVGV